MNFNLDFALEKLYRGEILNEMNVKEMCESLKDIMINQSNVRHIKAPVTVVGNLHAYFYIYN